MTSEVSEASSLSTGGMLTIDTAHLLCNHDDAAGLSGSAKSRDREQLHPSSSEVALVEALFRNQVFLCLELCIDVVQIPGSLEWSVANAEQGAVGFRMLAFLDQPTSLLGVSRLVLLQQKGE